MALLIHTSCVVSDLERATAFYDELLATIGGKRIVDVPSLAVGYGREGEEASFWLQSPEHLDFLKVASHCHFAYKVDTRAEVMAFHDKAIELGAKAIFDSRQQGVPQEYLGFVFEDLDGHMPEIYTTQKQ